MEILPQISEIIQTTILPLCPLQKRNRLLQGIRLFGLHPFTSLNSSGRLLTPNRKTGESYVYRLLRDCTLRKLFLRIFWTCFLKKKTLFLSLDFTDINAQLQLACLALTTFNGRALPLWVKACDKRPKKGTMIRDLVKMLKEFLRYRNPNTELVICMDRWFHSPRLLRFLHARKITFICRMKSNIHVFVPWRDELTEVGEVSRPETRILHRGMHVRLILSKWKPSMKGEEPWFLITNDQERPREEILRLYRKRFEIEELFKDIKWVQRYEWVQVKTKEVLESLVSFIMFGWWILYEVRKKVHVPWENKKQRLSWFRGMWEILARERFYLVYHPSN